MPTLAEKKTTRPVRPAPELIFGDLWEFDPAPETADPKLKPRYDLFIGGQFVAPRSGKYFDSINPANEQKLAEIALAGRDDVDAAYAAAQRAFDTTWGKLPGRERAKYLYRIARLLQDRARESHAVNPLLVVGAILYGRQRIAERLPAAEVLDDIMYRSIALGFAAFGVSSIELPRIEIGRVIAFKTGSSLMERGRCAALAYIYAEPSTRRSRLCRPQSTNIPSWRVRKAQYAMKWRA